MFDGCPHCGSMNVTETDKFDATDVDKDECVHDFECDDCECLFTVTYAPIGTSIHSLPEKEPA